jgi:DNA-binding transcriptional LysR family regulator
VEVDALRGQTFVQREPGSGTRDLAEQVLGPLAGDVSVALELAQPEGVVRAVEAGMGLAFISELIVTDKLAAGAVRQIPLVGVQLSLDVSLVVARDRLLPPASAQFRDFLLDA